MLGPVRDQGGTRPRRGGGSAAGRAGRMYRMAETWTA